MSVPSRSRRCRARHCANMRTVAGRGSSLASSMGKQHQNGEALQHASQEMKDDYYIVRAAWQQILTVRCQALNDKLHRDAFAPRLGVSRELLERASSNLKATW